MRNLNPLLVLFAVGFSSVACWAETNVTDTTAAAPKVAASQLGDRVTVKLSGGAEIVATLLRRNEENLVLDLGRDVIVVESSRVLSVRDADDQPVDENRKTDIYQVGRLKVASVPKLVERFGDAVVTVTTPLGVGSGFIISDEGHIITNYHVIEKTIELKVTVFKKTARGYEKKQLQKVKIIAANPLRDLALLQLDADERSDLDIESTVISEQPDLSVGDLVFAIGNPLGWNAP